MTVQFRIYLLMIFILAFSKREAFAQEAGLHGPILGSRPVGGDAITFQDVGTSETWLVSLPDSSTIPISWSPDGCNILMRGSKGWFVLSIPDRELRQITQTPLLDNAVNPSTPFWSFDGKTLTLTAKGSEKSTQVYLLDVATFSTNLIFSLPEIGQPIEWISEIELLYRTNEGYFILNTENGNTRPDEHPFQLPLDWLTDPYISEKAPSREYTARYYSLNALDSFVTASQEMPPPEDITPEYIATLEAVPKVPGFDIYTAADGSIMHVDVMRQFLQFLAWSPSSDMLVITTDANETNDAANGIYVYSLIEKRLQRIANFPAMMNTEYGSYNPSWSPDGKQLAFNTPDGYVIYNLETDEIIKLSSLFEGFYMSLLWSPISDYTKVHCAA